MPDLDHTSPCPYCGMPCECDLVDVGVGLVQCGPYHCDACDAYEAGPNDYTPDDQVRIDSKTGWFPPGSLPGSSANMVDGRLATADEMRAAYHAHFSGSADYHEPGRVAEWFSDQRAAHPTAPVRAAAEGGASRGR